jgi:DNA-binding response OmpR family regulator
MQNSCLVFLKKNGRMLHSCGVVAEYLKNRIQGSAVKQILVIDDDIMTLEVLRKMLEAEGYSVITALDGQKGIEAFHSAAVDLVITDLVMPVKDGLRTIMELRKENQRLPIIAISAGGTIAKERYLTAAQYLGDITAIPKPLKRKQIVDTVKQLLRRDEPRDVLEI